MIHFFSVTTANNVWKLNAVRLFFWLHFMASVLVPFFRDWGGISFTQIMLLNAWFMFWNFLLEIPTGTVADFWGRTWFSAVPSVVLLRWCMRARLTSEFSSAPRSSLPVR